MRIVLLVTVALVLTTATFAQSGERNLSGRQIEQYLNGNRMSGVLNGESYSEYLNPSPTHPAVLVGDLVFTYADLDGRANQLARYLKKNGVGSGDRIGVMLNQTVDTYAALLAVLKLNAAYLWIPAFRLSG